MGLIFVTVKAEGDGRTPACPESCKGNHPRYLYRVRRKMHPWGHFATAMLDGESRVIDASLPTEVLYRAPKGAVRCTDEETARAWHEDNESHVFGGPNVAAALRAAVKEANARPCSICGWSDGEHNEEAHAAERNH